MPARALSAAELPDDVDALKRLVLTQAAREQAYEAELARLREQLNLLLAKRYGPSSEKISPDQLHLFNEAEAEAEAEAEGEPLVDEQPPVPIPVASHTRPRRGRRPLPEALPRVRIEHDLAQEEKTCACGCALTPIGEEVSEQLDIVPAQVRVLQHVRFKYACRACEETIQTAPLAPQPIPKSNASPGLLAHIAVAKYQDALPLARQERILTRNGVDLPRATLAAWMIKLGLLLGPVIAQLRAHLLAYDIVQMDETRIQVLKEDGRDPSRHSFMWVQRGGPPHQPVLLFHYDPSRGQGVALELLVGFRGFLQSDGFEVYAAIAAGEPDSIRLIGCFAHARRKFDEALKAQGKPTKTGKALAYLHTQWPGLIGYLADGRLAIDNNACERAIRPFVIGRRNWLFDDTPKRGPRLGRPLQHHRDGQGQRS